MSSEQFQQYLLFLRSSKNYSQKELAELSKLSVEQICRLETGSRGNPRRTTLTRISNALELGDEEKDQLFTLAGYAPSTGRVIISDKQALGLSLIDLGLRLLGRNSQQ